MLVTASWALPARPAATALRELARRWGEDLLTLLIEEPDEQQLEELSIDVLPTWSLYSRGTDGDAVPMLSGTVPHGGPVELPGPWVLTRRESGALPKHRIQELFGP